jgi:hypothetical protein
MRRSFKIFDSVLDRFGLHLGKKARHTRQHKGRLLQIEPLEQRQLLTISIGSLAATPSVMRPDSVTLTASDLHVDTGRSVTKVEFYLDSNGDAQFDPQTDQLLGYGVDTPDGWRFTFSSLLLRPGTQTYFAQATDNTPATP